MNKNIRRFAAAVSLTFVLSATPVIAAPSRDGGDVGRERTGIVRVVQRILNKIFRLTTTSLPTGPIPVTSPTNP